jgi:DNA-directed RNA polymerase specialized sigma subunit
MKIPLNMDDGKVPSAAAQVQALERDILAAKRGDWTARNNLARSFTPLISSLAEKRTAEPAKLNDYIEAGKKGLFTAAKKFKPSMGADKFQVFALDFIESSMDTAAKGGGFFARLFGGKG